MPETLNQLKFDDWISQKELNLLKKIDTSIDSLDKEKLSNLKQDLEKEKWLLENKITALKNIGPVVLSPKKWDREKVRILQEMLGINVDGIYGKQTAKAVMRLQKEVGVKVDGAFWPKTYNTILKNFEEAWKLIQKIEEDIQLKLSNKSSDWAKKLKKVYEVDESTQNNSRKEASKTKNIQPETTKKIEHDGKKNPWEYLLPPENGPFKGIKLKNNTQVNTTLKLAAENLKEGKSMVSKLLFKDLLSNPDNLYFSLKVNADSLKWIDTVDPKKEILNIINSKLENTKVKVENKEVSLDEYLKNINNLKEVTIQSWNVEIKNVAINDNVKDTIKKIISESLPEWTDITKVNFVLNVKEWKFVDVKITDEQLWIKTFDIWKELTEKDIQSIDDRSFYKISLKEGNNTVKKIVKWADLKEYLSKLFEEKKEEYIENVEDKVADIKIDGKKMFTELFGELTTNDKEPEIDMDEGNGNVKFVVDVPWNVNDMVVQINQKELTIRDEYKYLPEIFFNISGIANLTNSDKKVNEAVSTMYAATVLVDKLNSKLNNIADDIDYYGDSENIVAYNPEKVKKLKQEKEKIEKTLKDLAEANNIDTIKTIIKQYKEEVKKNQEQEKENEQLRTAVDKLETYIKNITFSKHELEGKVNSEWLNNFSKEVELDLNDIKVKDWYVEVNFDFDDNWINEEFDKDITVKIPVKDLKNIHNVETKFRKYLVNKVIPSIADLSTKWKEAWSDSSKKTFILE